MGETSYDIQREIESLRREADCIAEELQDRARGALDLRRQMRASLIGTFGAVGLLVGTVAYARWRHRQRPARRSLTAAVSKLKGVKRPASEPGMYKAPMLRRILWAMFSAGMVALVAILARSLSTSIWQALLHEKPPKKAGKLHRG